MASRQRSGELDSSPGAGGLDQQEGLADIGPPTACSCRPEYLRLRSEHGELVTPRGHAVNRCLHCAKLAAMENCEMLVADAMEGHAPTVIMVLTTRTPTLSMKSFRAGRDHLVKAVRRRWPDAQYACQVEYSTGMGPRSGGRRRPHWNWFWKGIPDDDIAELRELVRRIWPQHVDALPAQQYIERIDDAVGLTKYVTRHFMKMSQAPPAGFTGQRFNTSTGYFGQSTRAQARARARDALALKREIYRHGLVLDDAHEIELAAQLAHRRNLATTWTLASETGGRLGTAVLAPTTLVDRLRAHLSANAPEPRPVEPS